MPRSEPQEPQQPRHDRDTGDELAALGVPVAPTVPQSRRLVNLLESLGFGFRLNQATGLIEVNGKPIDDMMRRRIRTELRDAGASRQLDAAEDAYITEAQANAYHPVKDWLQSLTWDGADRLQTLCNCFHSDGPVVRYDNEDGTPGAVVPLHHVYLFRWMLGAVRKVLYREQNMMLCLDGPQDLGKSTFCRWLASGLPPEYHIESQIDPSSRDADIRLFSHFVWEVPEVDATTKKADVAALKGFITRQYVTVRRPYDRYDTIQPAMASMIGTVNNVHGFLNDESGERRFLVMGLTHIDHSYSDIDVNQLWAQVVHEVNGGQTGRLLPAEAAMRRQSNQQYITSNEVIDGWLDQHFIFFDPDDDMAPPLSMAEIITHLAGSGVPIGTNHVSLQMTIGASLRKLGAKRVDTGRGKRWAGVDRRPS